jgi:hypothetical protein
VKAKVRFLKVVEVPILNNCSSETWPTKRVSEINKFPLEVLNVDGSYLENLENRVEKLEKLLRRVRLYHSDSRGSLISPWKLCPDEAAYNQLIALLDSNSTMERPLVDPSALVGDSTSTVQSNATLETVTSVIRGAMEDKSNPTRSDPHNDDDPSFILADNLKQMALTPNDLQFFGKSSRAMLAQTAMELRNEYSGDEGKFNDQVKPALKAERTEFWDTKPVSRLLGTPLPLLTFF